MPKKRNKLKRKLDPEISQISDDLPLAIRTKKEEENYQLLKEITTELNEDDWVKAVKLMNDEWNPYPPKRRCYSQTPLEREWGIGISQNLVLQFKRAVLSRNWTNAVRLAFAIFKNYFKFNERLHLQVLLSILMSHPQVNEDLLSRTCSFIWQMDRKDAMAELLRCFCSMPKALPAEFVNQTRTRAAYTRTERNFLKSKALLEIKYTAHLVDGISDDNDMYIQ